MTTREFLSKYKNRLNIKSIELFSGIPHNTISRAINKEERYLGSDERKKIKMDFEAMFNDFKRIND